MKNKKILFILFILVVAAQLYVPVKMILNQEDVLKSGTAFKFKTIPFDPNDPLRGKYIRLNFEENKFEIQKKEDWIRGEEIYVIIKNNDKGFAEIKNVVKEKPASNIDFIKAKVDYVQFYKENKNITIKYPFERYYMEESKAKDAENLHRESLKNKNKTTYALVYVKNGETVLEDVLINNESIKDIVVKNRK